MKRYFCIISGIVQGVGFRHFCAMTALKHGCTGTVRNMLNGMVEVQIQGDEQSLETFIREIKNGNRFIKVENISIKEIDLLKGEKNFRAVY